MSSRSTFNCFGLVIHGYGCDETLDVLLRGISEGRQQVVVTANPEILLEARSNPAYWDVLRNADLRLVDGVALKIVGWFKGGSPKRCTGVDLSDRLLKEAAQWNWKVALVGGDPGNADKAAWKIREKYPELSVFAEQGGRVGRDGMDDETGEDLRFRLTQFAPDILLVGFGHPKQEMWIARFQHELPSVKIAVGVGGTIDYWSGAKTRAPKLLRVLGLEWLWRLFTEPRRWKRIFNAVVVFPILAFADFFKS